jgi:hypothetical protein
MEVDCILRGYYFRTGPKITPSVSVRTPKSYRKIYFRGASAGGLAGESNAIITLLLILFRNIRTFTMEPTLFIPTLKTPRRETSRDQCLRIHTLYFDAGWTQYDIAL